MKEQESHLTKGVRKDFSSKKKKREVFSEDTRHAEPYKKPKTNFKMFIDELCEEDWDNEHDW